MGVLAIILFIAWIALVIFREYSKTQNIRAIKENALTTASEKCKKLAKNHERTLAIERDKFLLKDVYGNYDYENWKKNGVWKFFQSVVAKNLDTQEYNAIISSDKYFHIIDYVAKTAQSKSQSEFAYNPKMNGIEYELLCKKILSNCGWEVNLTKASGDQGIDLLAQKGKILVAIQCKKYSSQVGNKSVQEAYAGKQFYSADFAVVVSNASFTKSAKELANKNNVVLLHHNQLGKLNKHI